MSEIEKEEGVVKEETEDEEKDQEEEGETEDEDDDEEEEETEDEEEEEKDLDHWSHRHPLTLVEARIGDGCYGCRRLFKSGDLGYGCKKKSCGYEELLHEECAEMEKKIRHHMHPQHILIQKDVSYLPKCAICRLYILGLGYYCTSSRCDQFQMHIGCAQDKGDDIIRHRCHPEHELRFLRRKSSFRCDACCTKKSGYSYLCTTCEYWIHSRCASLPDTIQREDHHHSLSLSFTVPPEYIEYKYRCEVCDQELLHKYWIYHCHLCRYAVHINCAFKKSPHATTTTSNNENEKNIIRFPMNDVGGEQIRAFVMKAAEIMPPILDGDDHVKYYTFHHHKHQLTLISSSSSSSNNIDGEEEEEEENSSDEEDNDYTYKSKLICDGCITPIRFKRERSNQYLSCRSCKYYLHWECFHLPPHLPSLNPLHQQPDHQLVLQSAPKLDFDWEFRCSLCELPMNGLFYGCTRCEFKADINCSSVPNTIYHSAHPHHPLNLLHENDLISKGYNTWDLQCSAGCNVRQYYEHWYVCDSCDEFMLHVQCAMLPPSVRDRRWDKHHLLPLTYDANLNHPDEFYCDHCETQMNPKRWMYHCRPCDLSFHPFCFKAASGLFRNIKFGQQYHINSSGHPHPLTFQLLTTKRSCDVCREDAYTYPGFHCASCNFFICFYNCIRIKRLEYGDIQAVE